MKKTLLILVCVVFFAGPAFADSVTLISPNGGEVWPQGFTQVIQWRFNGGAQPVSIILTQNGQLVCKIATNVPPSDLENGYFKWVAGQCPSAGNKLAPPAVFSGKNYLIEIKSADRMLRDASDKPFAIE
jgi:hypothetical protein